MLFLVYLTVFHRCSAIQQRACHKLWTVYSDRHELCIPLCLLTVDGRMAGLLRVEGISVVVWVAGWWRSLSLKNRGCHL